VTDKKSLSERDICTQFIVPALKKQVGILSARSLQEFRNLDDFLSRWSSAEKKKAVIDQLAEHDIILENLLDETKRELDLLT